MCKYTAGGRLLELSWSSAAEAEVYSWGEAAAAQLELSSVLCDDLEVWDGRQNRKGVEKVGDICTYTADSLCCTAETNTTL